MKIGLSFIFGNVSEYLPRFLESFAKLTPHLYGVRAVGGLAPDDSWQICEKAGVQLAEYKNQADAADWHHLDNFAAARNQAARLAEADGCDWILWADTDDILEDLDRTRLIELLSSKSEKVDFWLLAYALTNNGLRLPRERAWRAGRAKWIDPIHENCEPDREAVCVQCMDVAITHKPDMGTKKSPPDRNLKIIEARMPQPLQGKWAFYRAQELIGLGRNEDAQKACQDALKTELSTPERYELLINLSGLTTNLTERSQWLGHAYHVDPTRREALACLAAASLDRGLYKNALAYSRAYMALPAPQHTEWTHRAMLYGWAGVLIHAQALRMNGMAEEADRLELDRFKENGSRISLIHATRSRPYEAAGIRKLWLERAKNAEAVEHLFAIGQDDLETLAVLRRFRHVIAKDNREAVPAETCYNAAAKKASGRILVAIADGMIPPVWWDEQILAGLPATGEGSLKGILGDAINGNGPVMAAATRKKKGHLVPPLPPGRPGQKPKISILHATRGRPRAALACRQLWMARCEDPWSIEWIFSTDEDDATAAQLQAFQPLSGPPGCVAAWNRAAAAAKGEVLVQMSDDWDPPAGWDKLILERIGATDRPAVLAVSDGRRTDQLLCMAILTRKRWEEQGHLFAPEYNESSGIFSDGEFTARAYAAGCVVEARDLVFQHNNPFFTGAPQDEEFKKHNAPANYTTGERIFRERNPAPQV